MADINVGTMTLAQMVARIIEKQDTFEGGSWILSMIDRLAAERDEARGDLAEALRIARENAAEVERLRPAAEAWEAWREFDELVAKMPLTRDTEQEQAVQDAATKRSAAYARARAAKEAK